MSGARGRQMAGKHVIDAAGREGIMKAVVFICEILAT
jgi:hypothetical protein